jgi:4-amino-4-deoxy-L-arabinose transferase-like glycosyltransferase
MAAAPRRRAGVYRFFRSMEHEPTNRRLLLWAIIAGLVAWGALLGLGAYLGLDPQTPDRDYRRLWVVVAMTGGFLVVWLIMLALKRRQ